MKSPFRRNRPRWRAQDARVSRPGLWLLALGLVGMLLVEVGQSSRMAELSLQLDQNRAALVQAQARLEFVRAQLERRITRAELAPQASKLGRSLRCPRSSWRLKWRPRGIRTGRRSWGWRKGHLARSCRRPRPGFAPGTELRLEII